MSEGGREGVVVALNLPSHPQGCLLNYALFLCTNLNSALTTTIVGVLKSVVAVVLGFFLLGGVKFNAVNVIGIALNTVGGVWYSCFKFYEKSDKLASNRQTSADGTSGSVATAVMNHSGEERDVAAEKEPLLSQQPEKGGGGKRRPLR